MLKLLVLPEAARDNRLRSVQMLKRIAATPVLTGWLGALVFSALVAAAVALLTFVLLAQVLSVVCVLL